MSESNQNLRYIDFFDLYPDEPVLSGVARYRQKMLISSNNNLFEMCFNRKKPTLRLDFPKCLGILVASLAPGHWLTESQILNNHTLFPILSPWLQPHKRGKLRDTILEEPKLRPYSLTRDNTLVDEEQYLKYCSLCVTEDRSSFGECYWHLQHQIINNEVCAKHFVHLKSSKLTLKAMLKHLITLEEIDIDFSALAVDSSDHKSNWFLQTAQDINWLFTQQNLHPASGNIFNQYQLLLSKHPHFKETYFGNFNRLKDILKDQLSSSNFILWSSKHILRQFPIYADYHNAMHHLMFLRLIECPLPIFFKLSYT